jgi:hypothetical protein
MSEILQDTYEIIEAPLRALHLNTPAKRFAFGAAVGVGITMIVKPGFAYAGGQPRPWSITSPSNPNATTIPFWMPGAALGLFLAVFI